MSNPQNGVKAQNAQLDWLTMTTRNEEKGVDWLSRYSALKSYHPALKGCEERYFSWHGYDCRSLPGVLLYGMKDNGEHIFQAVSSMADDCFPITYGDDVRVTRLDIAVTIQLVDPIPDLAETYYKNAIEGDNLQRRYTMYVNSLGGSTLYVGSRSSDQYGRVYDKGKQQHIKLGKSEIAQGLLWRYEVCIKKPKASPMADIIMQKMPLIGFCEETRAYMARFVYSWFYHRCVKPIFVTEDMELPRLAVEYTETSAQRKLRWIKTQVRPSMVFLLDQGFQEELQEAIGYDLVPRKNGQTELPF